MANEDIKYSPLSFSDPVGRVFFSQGRVFRAISDELKDEVNDFLKSELFKILVEKEWIVKTWVADDIHLDGYSMILEHERLYCVNPEFWSFAQLKEACLFTINLNNFCEQYGYHLKDAQYSNLTFSKGHLIFIDFGSFVKGKGFPAECFFSLMYLPLYYRSQQDYFLSNVMLNTMWQYVSNKIVPHLDSTGDTWWLPYKYANPAISRVTCYFKSAGPHFTVHKQVVSLISHINNIVSKLLRTKKLIKVKISAPTFNELQRLESNYGCTTCFPFESGDILRSFVQDDILNSCSLETKLMLYGNFKIEDVLYLKKHVKGKVILASNDAAYVDYAFKCIFASNVDVPVLCLNIMMETNPSIIQQIHTDFLIMDEMFEHLLKSSLWQTSPLLEGVGKMCNILYTSTLRGGGVAVFSTNKEHLKAILNRYIDSTKVQ